MTLNNISELVLLRAHELAERIQLRHVSCREVMQAYLGHIERFNPNSPQNNSGAVGEPCATGQ